MCHIAGTECTREQKRCPCELYLHLMWYRGRTTAGFGIYLYSRPICLLCISVSSDVCTSCWSWICTCMFSPNRPGKVGFSDGHVIKRTVHVFMKTKLPEDRPLCHKTCSGVSIFSFRLVSTRGKLRTPGAHSSVCYTILRVDVRPICTISCALNHSCVHSQNRPGSAEVYCCCLNVSASFSHLSVIMLLKCCGGILFMCSIA